jgi:copper(I)-binding protein
MSMPRSSKLVRRLLPFAVVPALALGGLTACGDSDTSSSTPGTTAAPGTTAVVSVGITASGAWARTSPVVAEAGAAYMTLTNTSDTDDELVGASVPATVAARAEVHESSMGEGGMMAMNRVDSVALPAGATLELAPGGYHIMLLQLAEPLAAGTEIPITLTFAQSGDVKVIAEVRAA